MLRICSGPHGGIESREPGKNPLPRRTGGIEFVLRLGLPMEFAGGCQKVGDGRTCLGEALRSLGEGGAKTEDNAEIKMVSSEALILAIAGLSNFG